MISGSPQLRKVGSEIDKRDIQTATSVSCGGSFFVEKSVPRNWRDERGHQRIGADRLIFYASGLRPGHTREKYSDTHRIGDRGSDALCIPGNAGTATLANPGSRRTFSR